MDVSIRTGIFNEMKIDYPNNVTVYNNEPYYQEVSVTFGPSISHQFNITITNNNNSGIQQYMGYNLSIPINSLFLSLESFQYFIDDVIVTDVIDIPGPRNFLLSLGQLYIIYIKTIAKDYELDLDLRLEQFPIELKSNEIQIQIQVLENTARYETKSYDITDFISSLGGFYGVIAGIFVLFFGMDKLEPWGLAQKYIFICTPCRRSLKRKFAKKYVSSAGIPLVEEINKRPKEVKESEESLKENVEYLKERVQILEALLEDYYLDAYYLKRVKKVITKHTKQEDLLEKYNQNKNEAESIDKKVESIDKKAKSKDEKAESKDEKADTIVVEVH